MDGGKTFAGQRKVCSVVYEQALAFRCAQGQVVLYFCPAALIHNGRNCNPNVIIDKVGVSRRYVFGQPIGIGCLVALLIQCLCLFVQLRLQIIIYRCPESGAFRLGVVFLPSIAKDQILPAVADKQVAVAVAEKIAHILDISPPPSRNHRILHTGGALSPVLHVGSLIVINDNVLINLMELTAVGL